MKKWGYLLVVAVLVLLVCLLSHPIPVLAQAQVYGSIKTPAPPPIAYTQRFDYDGSGNAIYIGMALSSNSGGPSASAAIWSIQRITYNGSNLPTLIEWAGGSSAEKNIWNNRASLSYQ